MPRDWRVRLQDILDAIAEVNQFTRHTDCDAFARDRQAVFAVAYALVIIGEAANALPARVQQAHPHVPWQSMRKMRNVLAHVYFDIDPEILWETAKRDLPGLIEPLERILGSSEP